MTRHKRGCCLLLALASGDVVGFCIGLPLLPDAVEPLVCAGLSDGGVGLEGLHVVGDGHWSDPGCLDLGWHHGSHKLTGLVHVLLGGVSLSRLGCLDGEEDKLGLVFLQTLDVQLKSLDAPVATPGVNTDANGLGLLLGHASVLKLCESEATSSP